VVKPEIFVAAPELLADAFVARLERQAAEAIAARGRFTIAVPGGSAASLLFPSFARAGIEWSLTEVSWSDERAVPDFDSESNYALADRLWLSSTAVPSANIHRLHAPGNVPIALERAAEAAHAELIRWLGDPPRFDVLLLGVGEDGHIASLFPGHPLLAEQRRYVAALSDSPKPPPSRLTLTLPAIAAARQLVIAALGSSKAAAIGRALHDPDCGSPLALALAGSSRCWLLLDPPAARELR
jgi:6-phosphogluconolactonase